MGYEPINYSHNHDIKVMTYGGKNARLLDGPTSPIERLP